MPHARIQSPKLHFAFYIAVGLIHMFLTPKAHDRTGTSFASCDICNGLGVMMEVESIVQVGEPLRGRRLPKMVKSLRHTFTNNWKSIHATLAVESDWGVLMGLTYPLRIYFGVNRPSQARKMRRR